MEEVQQLGIYMVQRYKELQEQVIKDVLFQVLKRPVVEEDAKDVTLVYREGISGECHMLYKNVELGKITFFFDFLSYKYKFSFIPFQ